MRKHWKKKNIHVMYIKNHRHWLWFAQMQPCHIPRSQEFGLCRLGVWEINIEQTVKLSWPLIITVCFFSVYYCHSVREQAGRKLPIQWVCTKLLRGCWNCNRYTVAHVHGSTGEALPRQGRRVKAGCVRHRKPDLQFLQPLGCVVLADFAAYAPARLRHFSQ